MIEGQTAASETAQSRVRSRLWIVSELYYPEQTSTGYFLTRIAEGLARDYEVHVVCGQPSYSERGMRAPAYEERSGTRIHRIPASHFDKDRLVLRVINLLTFTFAVFWFALLRFRGGDKLLVVTNPPTVPLAVGVVARMKACDAALLVHDVYPELLAATDVLRSASPTYRALALLFSWTYRLFDPIIVLGRDMAEIVTRKVGENERQIRLIPNWGDVDEIQPILPEENPFRHRHDLDGKFVVQFSGNIGRSHDVELLLDTARRLREEERIVFLFVGYGGKSGLVIDAEREGLKNVRFLPRQPRESLGEMLAASDATIISFVDGMYGLSVPSRMYNVMAAGAPIVAAAHSESELAMTVREGGAGWVLEERTPEELATLIHRLASDRTGESRRRGEAGRALVLERFTLERVLRLYREALG